MIPPKFHLIPPKFYFSPTWKKFFPYVGIRKLPRGKQEVSAKKRHQTSEEVVCAFGDVGTFVYLRGRF